MSDSAALRWRTDPHTAIRIANTADGTYRVGWSPAGRHLSYNGTHLGMYPDYVDAEQAATTHHLAAAHTRAFSERVRDLAQDRQRLMSAIEALVEVESQAITDAGANQVPWSEALDRLNAGLLRVLTIADPDRDL